MLSWSGGKDSTAILHEVRRSGEWEIAALLTTVTSGYDRVSVHGVRRTLLETQARSLGLPLATVEISPRAGNDEYQQRTSDALEAFREQEIRTVLFGDLFLEDVRRYREGLLASLGMTAVFPLWGRDTRVLAEDFQAWGYRAVLTCVDAHVLLPDFAGREFDAALLRDLPEGVDPCGENGEFHTFVYDGPLFSEPVRWTHGERVRRDERWEFCDLVPPQRAADAHPGR
ncbi:ATPase [soil metagenome]